MRTSISSEKTQKAIRVCWHRGTVGFFLVGSTLVMAELGLERPTVKSLFSYETALGPLFASQTYLTGLLWESGEALLLPSPMHWSHPVRFMVFESEFPRKELKLVSTESCHRSIEIRIDYADGKQFSSSIRLWSFTSPTTGEPSPGYARDWVWDFPNAKNTLSCDSFPFPSPTLQQPYMTDSCLNPLFM